MNTSSEVNDSVSPTVDLPAPVAPMTLSVCVQHFQRVPRHLTHAMRAEAFVVVVIVGLESMLNDTAR